MSGSGTPNRNQVEEQLHLQLSQKELIRTSCYYIPGGGCRPDPQPDRHAGAGLVYLRLDDTTSRMTSSGTPSRNQVEHLRRLDDPEDNTEDNLDWLDLRYIDDSEDDLAVSLVKSGLAKKILGKDNVTSGAA